MSDQGVSKTTNETYNLESKSNSPVEIDKTLLEDIIGTISQSESENLTEPSDIKNDHVTAEKTNEVDNSDQTNSKKSRELKLLLALSKEANLDTNISHKRNSLEGNKTKVKDHPKNINTTPDSEVKKVSKVAHDGKHIRYPVTAESELELDTRNSDKKGSIDSSSKISKRKREDLNEVSTGGATEDTGKKNKKPLTINMAKFKQNKDIFCWRCHREGVNIACETCPRSYHQKCLKQTINDIDHWPCPECVSILKAESTQTRSSALKGMTLEHLCSLLKFAVNRMIQCQGSEPFLHPVSDSEFPDYKDYIVQPMDLTKMEKNIKGNLYGSTQAFEADAKWLLHNSIIYNSYQSKLTSTAKSIIKVCKQEMAEIENCPSCYLNANTKKDSWFVEVCPKPHILVWAKLKGFPFWPAKAMCTNPSGMVDVRFFGAHDRAWVHYKECYLFSEKDPNTFKQKRYDIEKCIAELNIYIDNLRKVYGEFRYAPYKTLLDPDNELKQLQIFLPKYKSAPSRKRNYKNDEKINSAENKKDKKGISNNPEKKEDDGSSLSEEIKVENTLKSKTEPLPKKQDTDIETPDLNVKKDVPDINQNGANLNENRCDTPHSKFNDDSIMEGYGTDDDTNTEIDLERRNRFIGKNSDKAKERHEDSVQEEEEDDTQVSTNISIDSSQIKESDKKQGNVNFPDNTQILTRRASDSSCSQKRQSTEESSLPSLKMARRSSDLNIKNDSTLLPSISEKINIVDISENMEVTLGNDDAGCISISENISSDNEISNWGSEQSKRKPVQVDIENAELTISPTNKLKISDKLIKRLSDSENTTTPNSKVEEVRKNIQKSPTDILIEKFKNVVDHEIVDFSDPNTLPVDDGDQSSSNNESQDTLHLPKATPVSTVDEEMFGNENEETSKKENIPTEIINRKDTTTEETVSAKDVLHAENKTETLGLKSNTELKKSDAPNKAEKKVTSEDKVNASDENLPKKPRTLIQPSITEFTVSATCTDKNSPEQKETTANDILNPAPQENTPAKAVNATEESEDSEDTGTINSIQIDKNRIFNIIHSSLNNAKSEKTCKNTKATEESSATINTTLLNRKRKINSTENSPTQAKLVKLVSIDSIINKSKESESLLQKSLQGKKMIHKPPSSNSTPTSTSSVQEIVPEDIKSEPETDEDFSESENLEAKRKYLSALNISEKVNDPNKAQDNAIRTRSKTEEKREKFKKLDNLTRVIDDVVFNYNTNKQRQEVPVQKQIQKTVVNPHEIFVKSFAKIAAYKPRARKSFPTPTYIKPNIQPKVSSQVGLLRKDLPSNNTVTQSKKDIPKSVSVNNAKVSLNNPVTATPQTLQSTEIRSSSTTRTFLHPPNQSVNSSTPSASPMLTAVSPVVCATTTNSSPSLSIPTLSKTAPITPNLVASQNYIPQKEITSGNTTRSNTSSSNIITQSVTAAAESNQTQNRENTSNSTVTETIQEDESAVLNGLLPETVSRTVSDLFLRAPPKLKPRPPGPLSTIFDEGVPSSAGSVTSKINSVAHRLGDYFRGMLIETLEDLGKTSTPEAKIASLQLEIEALKHRHSVEMSEMRKNFCTVLRDIQKSIVEERERVVDETRAACEAETIKRIELAKSKQWCANCTKEAQFYCCWNTSYCDYPCQQKHWPQHVGKCTQNVEKSNNIAASSNRPPGQQLILRPTAPPKSGMGRIVAKPTKVYMNRSGGTPKTFKQTLTTTGNHLTVIETAPGNYELVGNGAITVSGKLLATNSGLFHQKLKSGTVMAVASPSSNGNMDQRNVQRIVSSEQSNTSAASASVPTVVEDDSD